MTLRSMLFVPSDSERKLAKAAGAGADALILDLEDSVLPERKELARRMARAYLAGDSSPGDATAALWVRVNAVASGELLRDLVAVVAARPAGIVLPKIRGPEDIWTTIHYLEALEAQAGIDEPIEIVALATETASAVLRMAELLQTPLPRLKGLGWGAEDLSAAVGAGDPRRPDGTWRALYDHARIQCLLAGRALGIDVLDSVYVDFRDTAGLTAACQASRHDGFTGRFAIHPDQVGPINRAFSASDEELAMARRIVAAFEDGAGAVSIDGKMYDIPHLNAARSLIERATG